MNGQASDEHTYMLHQNYDGGLVVAVVVAAVGIADVGDTRCWKMACREAISGSEPPNVSAGPSESSRQCTIEPNQKGDKERRPNPSERS